MRPSIGLAVAASVVLVACGGTPAPSSTPSETPDYSTGFGTEPTREVADQ